MDWVIGAFTRATLKSNGIGSWSQAVVEVAGAVCEKQLGDALGQISSRFPLIHGHPARDFNLAPCWKVSRRDRGAKIPLRVIDLPADQIDRLDEILDDNSNRPFASESQHVRVLLLRFGRSRSFVAIVVDHRLLDGSSTETIFRLIDETWRGRLDEISPRVKQTEPAHLNHWMRRLRHGRRVNRRLMRLASRPVCAMVMPPPKRGRPARFVHDSLNEEESSRFVQKAGEEVGAPIILPSALARAMLAVRQVFPATPLPGNQYVVFTTANMRPPGQDWETFFFNHISLLVFSLDARKQASTKEASVELRNQFFELMKAQFPKAIQDTVTLARICPQQFGSRALRLVTGKRLCTFYFVCLREAGFSGATFLGLPAVNLVHKPAVFSPPGLGVCMSFFRGRFNLVISYMDEVIEDSAAKELMRQFKSLLLQ
jgi:hypothetical protein